MVEAGLAVVSVAAKFTTAPQLVSEAFTRMVSGTTIEGAIPVGTSATVTVKLVVELFPAASVAVTVTVVVPTGKVEPLAGLATTVTSPEQLSVDVGNI